MKNGNYVKSLLILLFILSISVLYAQKIPDNINDLRKQAQNGNIRAQAILGEEYRIGNNVKRHYPQALYWLNQAAAAEDPIALYNLAILYETGSFLPRDTIKARTLYDQVYLSLETMAQNGDALAQVRLGNMLESPFCNSANLDEAIKWYYTAAKAGNRRAQFLMGYKFYYGWGVDKNVDSALTWLKRAADQGESSAQHFLGNLYFNGNGIEKNNMLAIRWHRLAEQIRKNQEIIDPETGTYSHNGIQQEGDIIIPGLLPPEYQLKIREGSCGEACLWSIINSAEFMAAQIEINAHGGDPGRGLHSYELHKVLDYYHIPYNDHMNRSFFRYGLSLINPVIIFSSNTEGYHDYLYNRLIPMIEQGHSVILGIKIYPDNHFFWDSDHFILLVGYNKKNNELIYNDFNKRQRISAEKLLNKEPGYSLINRYHFYNYIEIISF